MASTNRLLSVLFLGAVATAISACASPAAQECGATGIYCPSGTHCAAAQGICISDKNTCGDAHLDPGEVCDDGNTRDGDKCSADCKSDETCGNGRVDTTVGEVCDEPLKRDASGKLLCSADCKSDETCGNGITDTEAGEKCDDGGNVDGDGAIGSRCSHDCLSNETCGNGKTDRAVGENCDDGNTVDGDTCSSDCRFGVGCGNGHIDVNALGEQLEECDDGVLNNGSDKDCRSDCVINRCGDNKINTNGTHHEDCDDGDQIDTNGCTNACKVAACGDGILGLTEECDDHNVMNGDGCSSSCKKEFCGDGTTNNNNTTANTHEDCDTTTTSADCNFNCTTPRCGDGIVNPSFSPTALGAEQCDPPSAALGCSLACRFEHCGNGVVDPGEECDGTANCSADCHRQECGNGILDPGEECDDKNASDSDACLSSNTSAATKCKIARCGDGKIQTGPEQCDDGVTNGTAASTCSATCRTVTCGNGVVEQGEECDDNNVSDGDDCLSSGTTTATTCKIARCGDSVINATTISTGVPREDCDNGANNGQAGNGCSATCHTATCGNSVIDQDENCDDGPGKNGLGKRCNATCHLNVCGDGDPAGAEQCDAGSLNGAGLPQPADSLTCDSDCTLAVCGDGHPNTAALEGCDHGTTNGKVGDSCNSFCQSVACGNGFTDTGEQCDPGLTMMVPVPDSSTCDGDCTAVVCGDGRKNTAASENCDDGQLNGDPCAYGDPSCSRCNSDCTGLVSPGGPFCGDSKTNLGHEICDDGIRNGGKCAYGDFACLSPAASTVCDLTCNDHVPNTPQPNGEFCGDNVRQTQFNEQCDPGGGLLTPADQASCDKDCSLPACGDGHRNTAALEACDDGNTNACGSCSATCGAVNPSTNGTGSILLTDPTPGGTSGLAVNIRDGDTFRLNDGVNPTITFEFDTGGVLNDLTHQAIAFTDTDDNNTIATSISTAINSNLILLDITAEFSDGAPSVLLNNDNPGKRGNKPIIVHEESGSSLALFISGMSGAVGGDCDPGIGCMKDEDCLSGTCVGKITGSAGPPVVADVPGVCGP
jgi:cysteine-rich repeat protein